LWVYQDLIGEIEMGKTIMEDLVENNEYRRSLLTCWFETIWVS